MPAFSGHVDSVMSAERRQTALEAAADGIELPFSVVTVQFSDDDCRLDGKILSQIVADQLLTGRLIHDADEGIGYLPEILSPRIGIIDRNGKGHLCDIRRNETQIYQNLLVISLAFTGEIITHMLNSPALMSEISVKNKFLFCRAFSVFTQQKC